jgi:hypothetical protein
MRTIGVNPSRHEEEVFPDAFDCARRLYGNFEEAPHAKEFTIIQGRQLV